MIIAKYAAEITKLQWNVFTTYFIHKYYDASKFLYEFDSATKNFHT